MNKNFPTIISGFPGIGKSSVKNSKVIDLESSYFKKEGKWWKGYVDVLENLYNTLNSEVIILIPTHEDIRNELLRRELFFTMIIPANERKEEFLNNYKLRGNTDQFINLLDQNWSNWLLEMHEMYKCEHFICGLTVLYSGKYLNDYLK